MIYGEKGYTMKTKKIWAIYFSPTGTTKKTVVNMADRLAKLTGCQKYEYDFTLPKNRHSFASVSGCEKYGYDIVFFGTPTYAGRVPNVLLKYLSSIEGNGAIAVPVVTFGNRNFDNSLLELRDILENAGFNTIAAAAMACEHSFSYDLGAGRPDVSDLDQSDGFIAKLYELLEKYYSSVDKVSSVEVPGIPETYGGYYKPQDRNGIHIDIRKVTPKVSDNCINCGTCAEVCSMGSIDHDDVARMTGICIKCCACYKKCPVSARYFDDPGFLYHKTELEELYKRRAENKFFYAFK